MKFFALILALVIASHAMAVGPFGLSGQNQGNIYPSVIQTKNNSITDVGSGKGLIEDGNKNILVNPSFEHKTFSTGWTTSIVTPAVETTKVVDGKKSMCFTASSQAFTLSQYSSMYASQFADGVQGLAAIRLQTTHTGAITICSGNNSAASTTNCVTATSSGKWGLYKVPFVLGATNNGISISAASGSGLTCVDDAFVGAVDLKMDSMAPGVDQYEIVASPNGFGSTWTGNPRFSTVSKLQDSKLLTYTDDPAFGATWTANKAVDIVVSISGPYHPSSGSTIFITKNQTGPTLTSGVTLGISDRAPNYRNNATANARLASGDKLSFGYGTASMTRDIESVQITATDISSSSTYTSTNADTDWAPCTPGASSSAWGTSPAYSFECKRSGGDLVIKGRGTIGTTPPATELRLGLPVWNGSQLVSKNSSIIPAIEIAGTAGVNASSVVSFPLMEPSVSYITFGSQVATGAGAFTKLTGNAFSAGSQIGVYARIPIEGWDQSNVITANLKETPTTIGSSGVDIQSISFAADSGCTTACNTASCVICNSFGNLISTVTRVSAGVYRLNGINGLKYNCVSNAAAAGKSMSAAHAKGASTTSYAYIEIRDQAVTNQDGIVMSTCIGNN